MRNVWFRIQGTAKDGLHDWVSTYDEVQGHSDTREERRINGWLASQPIGTVAELGDGWTMTRIHPPARANDSKSARVLARSRWGHPYQRATLTKAGRKLARWRWGDAPAAQPEQPSEMVDWLGSQERAATLDRLVADARAPSEKSDPFMRLLSSPGYGRAQDDYRAYLPIAQAEIESMATARGPASANQMRIALGVVDDIHPLAANAIIQRMVQQYPQIAGDYRWLPVRLRNGAAELVELMEHGPPARANDSKSARVLARSRWGHPYQRATLTKAGRKLARWRWQSAGPAAAARVKLEAKRDTLRSDLSDLNAYRRVLREGGRDNQIERQLEQVQQDRIDLHDAIQKVDDQIERAKVRGKQQGSQLGLALGNPPQIARARRNPGSTLARAARRRGIK